MNKAILSIWAVSFVISQSFAALAQEDAANNEPAPSAAVEVSESVESDPSLGLNIDLGWASAYVFRGYNVFQEDSQMNQNMLLAPGITWSLGDTGLSIGYWGAFQLNGDNRSALVDGGVGAEQDLFVSYDLSLTDAFSLSAALTYYFYPAADEDVAGTSVPSFLEPTIAASFSTAVDLGLSVSYFIGLQDEVRSLSHFYLNPSISKSVELSSNVALDAGFGYGFKVWKDGNDGQSNVHDLNLGVSLPISLSKGFYVTPALNLVWTNLEDTVDATGAVVEQGFGDELAFFGGVNVGVDL